MDAEIFHDRLAAAEGAIIATDGRLDALENDEESAAALATCQARITSLEESLTLCLERLQTSETTLAEALTRIAEAQAQEAEAQAEATEAIAEAIADEQEAVVETEELADEAITELEPEPESDGEGPESNQPSWWEKLFTLR